MTSLLLAWRFLTSKRRLLDLPSILCLIGMSIGVASLIVSMAVVSGFEKTLEKSVQDIFGHVMLVKHGGNLDQSPAFIERLRQIAPGIQAATPFLFLEPLIVHNQKMNYVRLEGIDPDTVHQVLNIRGRVIKGQFDLDSTQGAPALIGKGIAEKFKLSVGDRFQVVLPGSKAEHPEEWTTKQKEFVVRGVVDLGKHEYDQRYLITDIKTAQEFSKSNRISGLRLRFVTPQEAVVSSVSMVNNLGDNYFVMHWRMVEQNLFDAIRYEKPVIFIVLMMLILAASFNVSSHLFLGVLRKYSDVSILRAMGASSFDILKIFMAQGLLLGAVGTVFGLCLGLLLCFLFEWIQTHYLLMPPDVYRIELTKVDLRWQDVLSVVVSALFISWISTWIPAWRGSRMSPVEGLRYD